MAVCPALTCSLWAGTDPLGCLSPPLSPHPWGGRPPLKDTDRKRTVRSPAAPRPLRPQSDRTAGTARTTARRAAPTARDARASKGSLSGEASARSPGLGEAPGRPEPARSTPLPGRGWAHSRQIPLHDAKCASSEVQRTSSWFQDSPLTLGQQTKFTSRPPDDRSSHLPLSRRPSVGGGTTRCP